MATTTSGLFLTAERGDAVSLAALCAEWSVKEVLDELDVALVGLAPVKGRLREIAALLLADRTRRRIGLSHGPPALHMCFTGSPGTGKTTVALRMAEIFYRLGYVRRGHLVAVTRDDLVRRHVGHTAPKAKDAVKRALGGVLFVDEACALHRPEGERDSGAEAIEILLQAMETHRDDLVVILAGGGDRMERFLQSHPGFSSRIAHHLEFPDYDDGDLLTIADRILDRLQYRLGPGGRRALEEYVARRRRHPRFANGRSIRNALDSARFRQASRLFSEPHADLGRAELMTIEAEDIRRSRVFAEAAAGPT